MLPALNRMAGPALTIAIGSTGGLI